MGAALQRARGGQIGLLVAVLAVTAPLTAESDAKPTRPSQDPRTSARSDVVGLAAPEWHAEHWINSPPLALADLRGRVVLVRFWTAPDCPYCSATAPALVDFHRRYAAQGLTVVGFYHHKSKRPLDPRDVEHYARLFGFEFPVAIDPNWATLRAWWLDRAPHAFTSASFLLDRRGIVRHVHRGGQFVQGDPDHTALEAQIQKLLRSN
jgi:thiol-disulfide isomerase/thioredoxin